ncbi:LysR family transcriptional regulator [Clostridium beijerinckii]
MSHAAEILFVSQPAVSKSIKTLETSFNVTLFSEVQKV